MKAKAKSKFSSVNTPIRIAEFKRQPAARHSNQNWKP
jgi:hypothetical protein